MTSTSNRADPLDFDLQPIGSTRVIYYAPELSHLDFVSRCAFAVATPYTILSHHGLAPIATYELQPVAEIKSSAASLLQAVEDLKAWLHVSYDDLAKILGWQSASTIHYWRRCVRDNESVQPRATSVEPILRLHALLGAVAETVSGDDPSAVELWARTPIAPDGTRPLELLEQGRIDDLERHAAQLLFGSLAAAPPAWRFVRPTDDHDLPSPSSTGGDYRADDFG